MSAEIEEQLAVVQLQDNSSMISSKKAIRSYTRDFLLSLSELEICKKLPGDFDESLLSEFQVTKHYGSQDRSRILGSSPLQGFRRTDYGSSPPTKGDSGSYSKGPQRWDNRLGGKSEGDSDSESGRRFGSQAWKTWQNSEHDGLLGSGSFPRPPGFTASSAVLRYRPLENLQLNKSNEPYQPPRPYKAGPYARRETKDSFNDETFGSSDGNSEDRAEEEKNRRAEFELMRKEQHKAFQESQKSNSGKPKDSFAELVGLVVPNDSEFSSRSNGFKEDPHDLASKLSVSSLAPQPRRPLVPPGFVSGAIDKSSVSKFNMHAEALQVETLEAEQGHQDLKSIAQERGSSDWLGEMSNSSNSKAEKGLSSILLSIDQGRASNLPGVTEVLENGDALGFDSEISEHRVISEAVRSTSILDKLFGNGLTTTKESISDNIEGNDPKTDDVWSPDELQSKFAHWFSEDDKTIHRNASSEKPNSLLTLIIGGEKDGSDKLNVVPTAPSLFPETSPGQKSSVSAFPKIVEMAEQFSNSDIPVSKPSVLTCEDLEQSMLLEIGGDIPAKGLNTFEVKKDGLPGTPVDSSASQHLLSLLQGGMSSNNATSMLGLAERPPGDLRGQGKSDPGLPENNTTTSDIRELDHSDRTLTLESLFGSAFMNELHSTQRNSVPPKMGESGNGVGSREGSGLASNDGITKLDQVTEWLDFQDTGKNVELSRRPSEADTKFGDFDGGNGVKLPEEDSLINLIDPINADNSLWISNTGSVGADFQSLSSNTSVNIVEKFLSLGATNDERSLVGGPDPHFLHHLYDMGKSEISYQNLHPQTSSAQFRRPPMNQSRTPFHTLDPGHIDPSMKFIPPETLVHRDAPTHHHAPTQHHPIPSPVLHHMLMAGNHPSPHPARGFLNPAPIPPHPGQTPAGFTQGHNPMQGFPFSQRQQSFGGPEMMAPGPELGVGNNPPESFQRLLDMELRANPKQMHPFGTGGPSRGMYGPGLDMGYRYW